MLTAPRAHIDPLIVLAPVGLVGVGILLLYSATYTQELRVPLLETPPARHAAYAFVGLLLMFVIARIDYRLLANLAPLIYGTAIALLLAVMFMGESINGVSRWINIGLFPLQPSELAKPAVAIALARYFSHFKEHSSNPLVTLGSLVVVGIPAVLVYRQPDLGSAVVFIGIWLGTAVMGGVRLSHLAGLGVLAVAALPVAYNFMLHGYMQERLVTWLNPGIDPLGAGYNILQSEISVG